MEEKNAVPADWRKTLIVPVLVAVIASLIMTSAADWMQFKETDAMHRLRITNIKEEVSDLRREAKEGLQFLRGVLIDEIDKRTGYNRERVENIAKKLEEAVSGYRREMEQKNTAFDTTTKLHQEILKSYSERMQVVIADVARMEARVDALERQLDRKKKTRVVVNDVGS